ncbi:Secreted protein containing internal repeats [Pseudoalteromonas tunicata D2]|jgi:hypothetical protein|uniref:Secreted protein containing internal repeats n=2 Tax=Pseudoalteromonas tunicata TaxID=314281 RepID=A4C7V3_9GAMM|nr:Secreted protein containing internal repeats [Pseudoalteromonas tunicata D2]
MTRDLLDNIITVIKWIITMKKLISSLTLIAALCSQQAIADSEKRIAETLTMTKQQSLSINFPVGSLEIEAGDSDQLEIEIDLKPKNSGWFSSSADLSSITLDKKITDNKISLEVDKDDLQQEWTIRLPRTAALDVHLGVGSIEINNFANSADIEVGVGSVRIDTTLDDFKNIQLSSGVGDTRVSGLVNEIKEQRKLVSSETEYRGAGQYNLNIEVGVGDIRIRR